MLFLSNPVASAAGMLDQLRDPEDGWIDASGFLLNRDLSFLPVPVIITEPALDSGLGAAGVFFHKRPEDETRESDVFERPSVSTIAGAVTGNESWFVGGGHLGIWQHDTLRYTGGAGYGSINLEFYGDPDDPARGLDFNGEGVFILQNLKWRLGQSDWWVGGEWQYAAVDIEIKDDVPSTNFQPDELDFKNSAIGAIVEFDNRDTTFTPSSGARFRAQALYYDEVIGSDFEYRNYLTDYQHFFRLGSKWVVAARLDGSFIDGRAPFFAKPFISMRGIPQMRYQGDAVVVAEAEARWDFHPRLSFVGFAGVGKAANSLDDLSTQPSRVTRGIGLRYFLAKALGLRVGIDVARGPEETAFYLTLGHSWAQ